MSTRTRKKLEKQEPLTDHTRHAASGWMPLRAARREAHEERLLGNRVVLESRVFGGWLMSGDWEPTRERFRVRYAQ